MQACSREVVQLGFAKELKENDTFLKEAHEDDCKRFMGLPEEEYYRATRTSENQLRVLQEC